MVRRAKDPVQPAPERDAREDLVADGFATVKEAATFLRLSRSQIYKLMDAGDLASAGFGRARRIPRRALHGYAARMLKGPGDGQA